MKSFDQWTEELTKVAFIRTDEEDAKVFLNTDDLVVEDDFEEE